MDKLKPCPFCGGEAVERLKMAPSWTEHYYCAECVECETGRNEYHLIDDWNRRAKSPWIRCEDRLPKWEDGDVMCKVWVYGKGEPPFLIRVERVARGHAEGEVDYWKPTGIERPQPPEV